jgi:hypothetical protein
MRRQIVKTGRIVLFLALLTTLNRVVVAAGEYEDKKHGYRIKILKDWTQTPSQPGEKIEVGKWKDDRDRDFADMSIYRFVVSGAATTPGTEDESAEADIPQIPAGWGMPDNAKDYLSALVGRRAKQMTGKDFVLPEPKELKFGKIPGQLYEFEFENKRWRASSTFHLAAIVSNASEEYLLLCSAPLNRAKKLKQGLLYMIRSFRFPGDDFGDDDDEDEDNARGIVMGDPDDLLDLEKRERIKKDLIGTWRYIDTPHYIVIFNCDVGLAKYIAKRCEYMRENAYEQVFPPVEPITECMVVRVCKEMDEYYHYGAPRGSAGYWASYKDELVFPDLAQSNKPDINTLGVMHHEGFHQYIYYALLKHNPPVWFNEGYAEYFFCVNFKSWNRKLKFDKRHPMRHSTVKNALGQGKLIPIKDFIKLTQPQYYANSQLCYSQGWAFATWLKNITRNKRYQEIPKIYFQEMQKAYLEAAKNDDGGGFGGLPPGFGGRQNQVTEEALEKAFEGIDLDELNEDFLKDIKRAM